MKKFILMFMILLMPMLAMAVPQVIFSEVNITMKANCTGMYYTLSGEGLLAQDFIAFPAQTNSSNCSINADYTKTRIPVTFSREIQSNDTDVAVLIHSLAINNNLSSKWENCINLNRDLFVNYTICQTDVGYKDNYTECINQKNNIESVSVSRQTELSTKTEELSKIKSQRTLLVVIALGCGFGAFWFWRKQNPSLPRGGPLDQLPSSPRF